MIYDQIANADRYRGLHPRIAQGLDYLSGYRPEVFIPGRIDLAGDALFAVPQEYLSKPRETAKWESHRRYADIQFIWEGEELMGYAPTASLEVLTPYNPEKDAAFYKAPAHGQFLKFAPGWFAIFFPEDGHQPGVALGESARIRKVVVKVEL